MADELSADAKGSSTGGGGGGRGYSRLSTGGLKGFSYGLGRAYAFAEGNS